MNKKIVAFVGESSFTKEITALIQTLSTNNSSVLLIGERGSGKRLIAQHIHFSIAKSFGYLRKGEVIHSQQKKGSSCEVAAFFRWHGVGEAILFPGRR